MAPGIEQGVDPASGEIANGHEAAQQHHSLQGRPAPGAPATAHPASAPPASTSSSTHAPSSADPIPTTASLPHTNNPPSSTSEPASSSGTASTSTLQQSHKHSYASSPQKRRNSQSQESYAATPATTAAGTTEVPVADSATSTTDPSSAAKRARPEVAPPKMLPEQYEFCLVEDMVVLIANMLGELIETNDALALKSGHLTRFHSRTPPGISVLDYLHRLAKHATLIPPLLLSMVYYIDRLCAMYPDFTINTLTVHRFLITAATVAAKGLSDSFWNNSTYARVGGVRVNELKMLELEFLYRLDWKIVPNPEVLAAYYRPLVERCPGYALPPDSTTAANSRSPSNDGDEMDDVTDGTGNDQTHRISHHRQSSTSLIGEDMVVSGLARAIRQERG
ncbi:nuc-1 negative regulatory protein preg [Ophiostoma piceae UAMH 11346]|uniref:Nuc-1 negative regulatory protein preg n=1 Tax=Ophiostoma piceae (strain UAMH 11346) TaxID=1262450 RepID=S3CQE0_OPHP1|nr:nuc-1 negative regulatory protein preg [Ophiostoma piceae UAMH 11346]